MKVTQATGPIASRSWENLALGFAVCSPASEGEWRVSGGWQIWVLKTQIFMRLLFQKASTDICSLGFAGVNNRVAAHLPGAQFLVINTVKEMDMSLLYDIMVWLEQNRETDHPSAWLWQHGGETASPCPHPFCTQLLAWQAGSWVVCIIPNTALAFSVPPLPGASGIPAAHTLHFICLSHLSLIFTLVSQNLLEYPANSRRCWYIKSLTSRNLGWKETKKETIKSNRKQNEIRAT